MSRSLVNLLLIVPLGYLVICAVLYFRQNAMVFHPTRGTEAAYDEEAVAQKFVPWLNAKGERIGWHSVGGGTENALLIINGNGGDSLGRIYYRDYCKAGGPGWTTFLLEYPGYGSRGGSPSEKACVNAAVEAIDTLATVPGRKIWVIGESLGSGVASAAVSQRPEKISGLVLVTPFDSLVGAAGFHYPWLPVSLLLHTRLDSRKNLETYPGPVAFLVGEKDRTVPAVLGKKLYENYPGRKRLWVDPEAGHDVSDLLLAEWPQIFAWMQSTLR